MANDIASDSITDTNTHTYDIDISKKGKGVYDYINGLDADIALTVYGTHEDDDTFSDAHTLVDRTSTGSGVIASNSAEYDTLSDPWDQLRVEVTAQSTPTSGTLTIKEMV